MTFQVPSTEISKFETILGVARAAQLEKLIFEPGQARGIDEKKTVVLITEIDVPDLSGRTVNLTRLNLLLDRMNLVKSSDDFAIELVDGKVENEVAQINFSGGKSKSTFKCASAEFIRGVPKRVNETWKYAFDIEPAVINHLASAIAAMGTEQVTLLGRDGCVDAELKDIGNDVFITRVSDALSTVDASENPTFAFNYQVKTLLPLLRRHNNATMSVLIGEKGVLQLFIGTQPLMVLPLI